MSEITDTHLSDWIWIVVSVTLVLGGLVGIVLTFFLWYQGTGIPMIFVDSGPLFLVFVTLIQIGLSVFAFLEAREERRLTRETLIEYRKDGAIEMIVQAVEKLNRELETDKKLLTVEGSYPTLGEFHEPDKELLNDLSPSYSKVTDDVKNYINTREEYNSHREELKQQIDSEIPEGLSEDLLDRLLRATGSSLSSVSPDPESDKFYERLERRSSDLSHIAMTDEPSDSSIGWIIDNEDEIREVLSRLRSDERFEREFEALDRLKRTLISKNERIREQTTEAKKEFKENYNISEAEIMKRKESTK